MLQQVFSCKSERPETMIRNELLSWLPKSMPSDESTLGSTSIRRRTWAVIYVHEIHDAGMIALIDDDCDESGAWVQTMGNDGKVGYKYIYVKLILCVTIAVYGCGHQW